MASRIVIDPVTRIEGHLRIEIAVQDGVVTDAFSSGTMVRGFELILKGRDPRDAWAFVERACGVCTTVHALASVRAVEDALGITVPPNADLIRNLMFCAQYLQDHVVHFYHLHALDWVDVVSALSADPKKTSELAQSLSNWPKSSPGYFSDLQKRLKTFVDSGQLGIFANAYWGHSAYKLPKEVNLIGVAHYLEALEQREGLTRRIADNGDELQASEARRDQIHGAVVRLDQHDRAFLPLGVRDADDGGPSIGVAQHQHRHLCDKRLRARRRRSQGQARNAAGHRRGDGPGGGAGLRRCCGFDARGGAGVQHGRQRARGGQQGSAAGEGGVRRVHHSVCR